MDTNNDQTPDEESREERSNPVFDFWTDEGARFFNEVIDEGSAYVSTVGYLSGDPEEYLESETYGYLDPKLNDADEETLPPGEMELIFENSYLM